MGSEFPQLDSLSNIKGGRMINCTCPICLNQEATSFDASGDDLGYECDRCGKFIVTGRLSASLMSRRIKFNRAAISYWIKKNQNTSYPLYVDDMKFDFLQKNVSLPKPSEQADNLIVYLAQNPKAYGEFKDYTSKDLVSVIGTSGSNGVDLVVDFLEKKELITVSRMTSDTLMIGLTFEGWEKFEELQRVNKESRLAFMAMQFNNEELAELLSTVIKPAISETGFEIRRLDDKPLPGLIDDRLRVEIRRSKFLVADLTDGNQGAYWEAGFAEGLGLPVIYICKKSVFEDKTKQPHFDTNHHLTVIWENTTEGLQKFAEELKAVIRNTFPSEAKMDD